MTGATAAAQARQERHRSIVATTALAAAASCALAATAWPILTTNGYLWVLAGLLAAAGIPVAVIDIRTHKLPNRYVAPIAAGGVVQAAALAAATTDLSRLVVPIVCGAIVFVTYTAMGLAGWFGFGDAKFAAALTVTVAIGSAYVSVLIVAFAVLLGGTQRLIATFLRRPTPTHPHGPALIAAALIILGGTLAVII
jgi:leader peptidase (prepilin peptidase)/N-methyltransferase